MRLDEKSFAAFAMASWRGQLQLAWTGTDMHLNLASSPDGREIAVKQRLDQRSYKQVSTSDGHTTSTTTVALAPSLAVARDRLFLAWRGSDAALNLLAAENPAQAPLTLRERSGHSPSVTAAGDGRLVLSWTGTDRRVNLLALDHDSYLASGAAKSTLEQARSVEPPTVCWHEGGAVLAWTGTDRRVNVLPGAMTPSGPPIRLEAARSSHAPALCSHQGSLVLAWTGTDHRVNVLTGAQEPGGVPVRLDGARTTESPALCSHQGSLFAGWSGTDGRLNLARLP